VGAARVVCDGGAAAAMEKGRKKGRGAAARVEEKKRGRGAATKGGGNGGTAARIGEEERGRLGLGRRGGLPAIGCEINGPKLALSSELSAPAEKCQNDLLFLCGMPPKTPNPNDTEHERK
jgi:hypothetical protein